MKKTNKSSVIVSKYNEGLWQQIVTGRIFESRIFTTLVTFFLIILYLLLAYKEPFRQNNLISNLEPGPDTFYYSVPAWNFIHGRGFRMESNGIEIPQIVPPIYGLYLAPFFKIFNDVRAYYFGNLILGFISIGLFLRLIKVFLNKKNVFIEGVLGLIFVSNFYFYNLATLLMAENILLPLTLAAMILGLEKFSNKNLILSIVVGILLSLTKVSSLPVVLILGLMTLFKLKNINRKTLLVIIGLGGIGLMLVTILVIIPNSRLLKSVGEVFAFEFARNNVPVFIKEFLGIGGKYLWFNNPQIESLIGWLSFAGLILGIMIKRFRSNTLWFMALIFLMIVFHASMKYAEGRYISTVIPVYMIFIGVILDLIKNKKIMFTATLILACLYLGLRTNVNGFYERKVTTLKRQILNNQLENNEVPWNYKAMENINKYFSKRDNDVYLITLLTPFYVQYFGNGNFNYLPFSEYQEFSGINKSYVEAVYENDGSLVNLYKRLINENKKLYLTNYYMVNYHGAMDPVYKNIENNFALEQVSDGCMDLCKIYKLSIKK